MVCIILYDSNIFYVNFFIGFAIFNISDNKRFFKTILIKSKSRLWFVNL